MLILFKRRSIYLSLKIDSNLVISEPPSKSGGSQLRVQLCAVNSWNHGFFGCFGRSEEGNRFVIRAVIHYGFTLTYDIVHGTGVTRLAVSHPVTGDHVELDHGAGHEVVHLAGELVSGHGARQPPAAVVLSLADRVF